MVLSVQARSGAIGATEPLANVGMLAPSGVTPFQVAHHRRGP